jgi:hypothetical protein
MVVGWREDVFIGVFEKRGCLCVVFGGENVVGCVVDVVFWMVGLEG